MAAMTEKELKSKYDALINDVNNKRLDVYDGRGKGVDVYICQKCGAHILTRYKDLGVTPFIMNCKNCGTGYAEHVQTISEEVAKRLCDRGECYKGKVFEWVRPSFEWLNKQRKKDRLGVIEHVLNGGLVLESVD